MVSVGIDVAKRSHEACVLDASGRVMGQPLKSPNSRSGVATLVATLQELDSPATIPLEASGHYWQGLYHHLAAQGFSVVVVNPLQTEAYRSTGVRKVKNDRRDAFVIADFLRIGRVQANYVPGEAIVQLRELTRYRMDLEDQIRDAHRFPSLESLVAYAGIDPSVFESGEFVGRRQHMSQRGSPYLRRALWLAAHSTNCRKLLARVYVVLRESRPYQVR